MRHPPHSVLLVSCTLSSAGLPGLVARGAAAASSAGHAVTRQRGGFCKDLAPMDDSAPIDGLSVEPSPPRLHDGPKFLCLQGSSANAPGRRTPCGRSFDVARRK